MNCTKKYTNAFLLLKKIFRSKNDDKLLVDKLCAFTGLYISLVHTNKTLTLY